MMTSLDLLGTVLKKGPKGSKEAEEQELLRERPRGVMPATVEGVVGGQCRKRATVLGLRSGLRV